MQGAWYIQETLDALTANPDVWSKTVLLINFDENDGYFDHVPPPAAPSLDTADGTLPAGAVGALAGASTVNTDLDRHTRPSQQDPADHRVYGVRVPMYVVSPWSRGGWVNSQSLTTPRCCASWKRASRSRKRTSARGAARCWAT